MIVGLIAKGDISITQYVCTNLKEIDTLGYTPRFFYTETTMNDVSLMVTKSKFTQLVSSVTV